jgi:hypothetical protein
MRHLAALTLSMLCAGAAVSGPHALPKDCAALLQRTHPSWKTLTPGAEVADWARAKRLNPVVTRGDFDGNQKLDWATIGIIDGKRNLALCLAGSTGKAIVVTMDTGCSEYVYTIRRKTKVPNLDAGTEEVLSTDVVATSCFEKSGRVFLYEGRSFRVFFISD